ncbi:hypothetical protein GCM10027596_26810 [Nocardioides korecus]
MVKGDQAIGARLRQLREKAGMTQAQVSDRLGEHGLEGIYPQTITRLESGARSLKWAEAVALAEVIGFELDALLSESHESARLTSFVRGVVTHLEKQARELDLAASHVATTRRNLLDTIAETRWDGSELPAEVLQLAHDAAERYSVEAVISRNPLKDL